MNAEYLSMEPQVRRPQLKLLCVSFIMVGLTSTGYFIYQGTQIGPKNQYSFAVLIQLTYCVVYPIIMIIIDPSRERFRRQLQDLGVHRAILCGLLWSINNVLITVPAAHLTGFYQTMGIGVSFCGCFLIEKVVQGTRYTTTQSVCVFGCLATFSVCAAFDNDQTMSWRMLYWFGCYLLNQVSANYAQVLMESSWAQSSGSMLYKVCHGNFVTNLCGLPFFLLSLPFYHTQHECIRLGNLWIPVAIAVSAIVYTLGSNVLMQVEDMTYSMMAGTLSNIMTLILLTQVDWNKGSTSAEEVLSYSIVILLAMVYMRHRSDHSGVGSEFWAASNVSDRWKIFLLVSAATVAVAFNSGDV